LIQKNMNKHVFNLMYLFKPRWDTGIPAPELVRVVEKLPAGSALDLGCGTGTNLRYLSERGRKVTGIDFATEAIRQARRKLGGMDATLVVGDVTRMDAMGLPAPYDLVLDMGCFHNLGEAGQEAYATGL
jgi:SAM-dependent methyltransferase